MSELRRHRVGLLVPSSDTVMENDLWRRLPPGITLHVARMYLDETTVAGEEKMLCAELEPATHRLATAQPELIIFGCTSAAALHGLKGDAEIAARIEGISGSRAITVTRASIDAIKKSRPERLFLFTPYVTELTDRLAATFQAAELPVVGAQGLGLDDDLAIAAVHPNKIQSKVIQAVRSVNPPPDAVFISCTTFRAFESAAAIERELNIPVHTSNKAVSHSILQHFKIAQRA
jgi:maleate isomerase